MAAPTRQDLAAARDACAAVSAQWGQDYGPVLGGSAPLSPAGVAELRRLQYALTVLQGSPSATAWQAWQDAIPPAPEAGE